MLDLIISFFISNPFILIYTMLLVLLVKVALFFKNRTRSWKLSNFLYFDLGHIVSSRSNNTWNAKKVQNTLSFIILVLAILQTGIFLLKMIT